MYIYDIFVRENTKHTVTYGVYIRHFGQGIHKAYGHIRCIYTTFLSGKTQSIRSHTVYIYDIFVREYTKHTVVYGVYIRHFCQGKNKAYGHIRCIYTVLANHDYNEPRSYGMLLLQIIISNIIHQPASNHLKGSKQLELHLRQGKSDSRASVGPPPLTHVHTHTHTTHTHTHTHTSSHPKRAHIHLNGAGGAAGAADNAFVLPFRSISSFAAVSLLAEPAVCCCCCCCLK